MSHQGVLSKYGQLLGLPAHSRPVTLLEGDTPLIPVPSLAREMGGNFELLVKFEGLNPTGSFKDRGMSAAVSEAVGRGAQTVICASTGNTAASAAAYAARAGMKSIVLIPQGKVAAGKLAGAVAYGAQVIQIDGSFDDALSMVVELTNKHPICLVNSINPFRIEGQKTAAFEICDDLGGPPDYLAIPVGNAGNITAYWRGFSEYRAAGLADRRPVMLGFQATGAAPIVLGHRVEAPDTVATAIRIGDPASWRGAVAARDESGGRIEAVTDDEILAAYRDLARLEGVFCEPASAASVAGLRKLLAEEAIDPSGTIVCVLTGHGLKDPETASAEAPGTLSAAATTDGVMEVLGW
jgi:threonine synthase